MGLISGNRFLSRTVPSDGNRCISKLAGATAVLDIDDSRPDAAVEVKARTAQQHSHAMSCAASDISSCSKTAHQKPPTGIDSGKMRGRLRGMCGKAYEEQDIDSIARLAPASAKGQTRTVVEVFSSNHNQ